MIDTRDSGGALLTTFNCRFSDELRYHTNAFQAALATPYPFPRSLKNNAQAVEIWYSSVLTVVFATIDNLQGECNSGIKTGT